MHACAVAGGAGRAPAVLTLEQVLRNQRWADTQEEELEASAAHAGLAQEQHGEAMQHLEQLEVRLQVRQDGGMDAPLRPIAPPHAQRLS
jgi:hypothetical protein